MGEPVQFLMAEGLPPMAVPMTVKMPEPMTAPMPRAVSETGPSVFFNACSGRSDSAISLSMDFVRKICLASALAPEKSSYLRLKVWCGGVATAQCHFKPIATGTKAGRGLRLIVTPSAER